VSSVKRSQITELVFIEKPLNYKHHSRILIALKMSSSRQSGRSRRRETEPHMRPYDRPEPSTRTTRSRARASSGDAPMPPPRPTSRTTLFTAVIEEPSRSTMETTPAARLSSAFRPAPSTPNTPRNRPLVRLSLTPHAKGGLFKRKVERLADMSNECFDEIIAAGTSAGGGSGDSSRQAERNWDALYGELSQLLAPCADDSQRPRPVTT
jgi:hypothetical protein